MERLLNKLRQAYPDISFTPGNTFCWSPEAGAVLYKEMPELTDDVRHLWSLLHETGHAVLQHQTYQADVELLKLELAAWRQAQAIGQQFGIVIDEGHVQDCLDTYRDWLHARSICPSCGTKCLQQADKRHYRCFNCHTSWQVTPSRFCRAYRSVRAAAQPATITVPE